MDVEGGGSLVDRSTYRLPPRHHRPRRLHTLTDAGLALVLVAAGANFLVWRARMLPDVGPAGWALFAIETVMVAWMAITAALFIGRSSPDRSPPVPDPFATIDVLIPVAGEPVELVATTIEAAKAIDWPVRVIVCNDGWMAGASNWRDIERLSAQLGVECLTRTSGAKGKAGNLNNALAYCQADTILTIDADHRVRSDVAQHLLGWLRHDEVAFVSTPQEFEDSRRDTLNPTEPVFYRATQPARDRHGIAFSTGNGVLYRREALVRIGGFSEWSIVEDLHTSIRLHAAGWKSVYYPMPMTIGIAPQTAAEYARQRLRWAIDSLRILRYDPPWRRRDLSWRARFHYTHTLISYLVTMVQVALLLGPPAWIIGRMTVLSDGGWLAQITHIGPWLVALAAVLVRWAGLRGAIRSVRLTSALLPTVFFVAAAKTFSPTVGRGTVTAKVNLPKINGLVIVGLLFPLGLVATMLFGIVDTRPGGSDLAMVWAAFLAALSVGPLARLGVRRFWPAMVQTLVIGVAVAVAAGSVAVTRFAWEPPSGLYASFAPPDPTMADARIETNELGTTVVVGPAVLPDADDRALEEDPASGADADVGGETIPASATARLEPTDGIYVGFTSDPLPHDLSDIDRWSDEVSTPQIVHWYQQWGTGDSRFRGDWLAEVGDRGMVPMVSWEAWAKPAGSFNLAEQELGNMADIANGEHDAYIDSWAEAAADYGDPILLRPFHEMNGYWYPWSIGVNGNTEETFVKGWRHVVNRFRAAGADNVSFVWSINTLSSFDEGRGVEDAYPGDDYVDWVASSGFNWDDYDPEWSSWVTAEWVFADTYELLESFDKPVMFAEIGTGTNGGDEAVWVEEAMTWFAELDQLGAIVWFDRSYDGRITFELGAAQQAAFAEAVDADDSPYSPELELVNVSERETASVEVEAEVEVEVEAEVDAGGTAAGQEPTE
ncbi:MAG: glycosyltransferase [Acidimicrobiales bacterium]